VLWRPELCRRVQSRSRAALTHQEVIILRAFITGLAGFAGSHLADYLLAHTSDQVYGVSLPTDSTRNLTHILDRVTLSLADLADYDTVRALLSELRPDIIFHLAAQASVGRSWADPATTLVNNITAQVNMLRAVTELGLAPRILIIGSADEYGLVRPDEVPVDEDTPLRPLNPYAVSKLTQDYLGLQYYLSHKLPIMRVRPFNHIGPRQGPGFVVPDFAKQIAEIEAGLREPVLHVGNLSAQRDFADVRDVVRAYYLAITLGQPGEVYNIGAGQGHTIQNILDRMLKLSRVTFAVEQDPERMRPSDIPVMVCDSHKLAQATGWAPTFTLDQSLNDVLDYWRESVRR
jgi:GDP-4-dehydro-6-deoxy-D-mannose reductase